MALTTHVHRLPMASPDDTSSIKAMIDSRGIDASAIIAILGKTEGNGCVNDYTRGYSVQSLRLMLGTYMSVDQVNNICLIMSGGTEGALAPHWIVISVIEDQTAEKKGKALAVSHAITRDLEPSEIGTRGQIDLVAEAVRGCMEKAHIADTTDVHFVQIKCPLLTSERIEQAGGPDKVSTPDTLKSMGLSRAASALGVAKALGEIKTDKLNNSMIGTALDVYSSRASCSAGVELMACEIVVLGMSARWAGPNAIDHTIIQDTIDLGSIHALLQKCLGPFGGQVSAAQQSRIKAVLSKAEPSKSGVVRGQRHTMLNDSDISPTRHARGFVAGLLAGPTGLTDLFVSGGAEHQGPDGGGPCALIYSRS